MANRFVEALSIKSQEQKQIVLMLCTGFFMGIFIATYQVTADSLFLNQLGDYLDEAFVIAGILGIVTTALFSTAQSFIKYTTLAIGSVVAIFCFTLCMYWLMHFGNSDYGDYYVFAIYCMTGPMTAVLLLSFWGIFGRLFNFRQSKRIIGWIDTGQLIAAILSTLVVIPISNQYVKDTSNYLFICALSMAIVMALMFVISSRFHISKNDPREVSVTVRRESRLTRIFGDNFIVLLSVFILVSMVMFVLSQFSFQKLLTEMYPNVRDLTNFNSFFVGSVYVISLIMQTFVNQRIINNYGLRISLFILPIIMIIFSVGAIAMGLLFGFEKSISASGFVYFFLFVAVSRLFNWTLRESLENPVFKLFFIPLDSRLRFSIQSKVEGLVNETARFVGGVIIFGLALTPFFNVLYICVVIILLSMVYFFIVTKIYNGYRHKIRQRLEGVDQTAGGRHLDRLETGFAQVTQRLESNLVVPEAGKAVFSYKLLEKINAAQIPQWANSLMKNLDEPTRLYAQERMNELKGLSISDQYVIKMDETKMPNSGSKSMLSKNELKFIIDNDGDITKARIQRLTRSANPSDRHYAAELLLHTSRDECTSFLMELLNDSDPAVRISAIKTSIKKNNPEIVNAVIENLGSPVFGNQAMNALVLIGAETLHALEGAFYRSGQGSQVMMRVIQVIGRIGGQRAREILWGKIDYPNKIIVSQVLLSLGECGFKAGISQITRIKFAIESDIADISWNLSAIEEVGEGGFKDLIRAALHEEVQHDIEHIYMLLTMLYDTRSIQLVKENIESGTAEGVTYAIELLDVFLSEQLKQRVIPILDDIANSERVYQLQEYYPRVKLDQMLVLKFLINRDFAQSNRWTKACVLHQIGTLKITDFKLDLIAQLFNPDELIREVAAWALEQHSHDWYEENTRRLGENTKRELDAVLVHHRKMSKFQTVLFYRDLQFFVNVRGIILSYLADITEEIALRNGESMVLDEKVNNYFFVIVSGTVGYYRKGQRISQFHRQQFVGEMLAPSNTTQANVITAESDVVLLRFDKDQFYELLSDNIQLADKVLEFI
jgi:AAA family ATP:ADP antiporter